jgi:peptidoglycan/LPS O-acetylase OafA/YrhL
LRSIEGLRGVLALWVVCGHALGAAGLGAHWRGPFAVLADGVNAVDTFIIVSGFVIFYLLDTAKEGYGRFLFRRALRLYPVYLVCLAASVPMLPLVAHVFASAPWSHPLNDARVHIAASGMAFLPQHILAHLLMVQSLLPDRILPFSNVAILGQAWSLSLEWQFYVVAPAFFWLFRRGSGFAVAAIAVACGMHFLTAGEAGVLPRHIPMFALGIASYFVWRACTAPDWPLLMIGGTALAFLLTHTPGVVLWVAVFLAALQPRAIGASAMNRVLESRPLLALGRWSYSIYLSHFAVLTSAMAGLEASGAKSLGQWPFFGLLLLLTAGGALVVSFLLYQFVEAPCIAWGRRMASIGVSPGMNVARPAADLDPVLANAGSETRS